MSRNINFGSRTEFLPGDRADNLDIKYERYGGCFITYKKGFLYILATLLFAGVLSYLVYHYFSCKHDLKTVDEKTNNILTDLLKSAEENESEITKDRSTISLDILPLYYKIKIQPFLDETSPKNFSFEGQVSIVFQIEKTPTKTIVMNVKDLDISQNEVTVTYTTSKTEKAALLAESLIQKSEETMLVAESQIKEEENVTTVADISSSTVSIAHLETTIDSFTTVPSIDVSNTSLETTSSTSLETTLSTASSSEMPLPTLVTNEVEESPTPSSTPITEIITESLENYVKISKQSYSIEDETYTIILNSALQEGINYTLNINFTGKISEGQEGILRSSYKQGNTTKWLVHTLLKPSFARTVFPCFDKPYFKTKFEVEIARRTNMYSVSNMHISETYQMEGQQGWVWDKFKITPPMSPHSVAFAVFEYNSTNSQISVPSPSTKLWGRREIENKGTYTLNIVPKLIETYNQFFGYKYSLNKVDLVAVPNLPIGSYGSWGILFFRENELLVEDSSSFEAKEHLLHTLSRELAQEWFGNLISVQSWSDSWLMETISNYAHYFGMNAVEKSWNIMEETYTFDTQDVLEIDSMDLLPKIENMSPNFEKDIDQQLLIAKKGSIVMRTLNLSLPELEFASGIKNFVNKWKYKNFVPDNFWEEFNSTENFPQNSKVNEIMRLWISQKGYPLVTITRNKNKSVTIQQDQFSTNTISSRNIWSFPLNYISESNSSSSVTVWLSEKTPKVIEDVTKDENNWVLFSSQAPCRINYDLDNWEALISLLQSSPETLSPVHRAQLLDDAFHLARTGLLNYTHVLNMTRYLREKEHHVIPWITTLKNFEFFNLILSKSPSYGYFEDYVINLLQPLYNKLINETSNDYSQSKLRKLIIDWSCKFKNQECNTWAITQYDSWAKSANPDNENTIPTDLKPIVYCMGVQNYGRSAWKFLWERYEKVKLNPDESKALIQGMGCATESWLLMKYLYKALEEDSLQNSILMWTSMTSEIAVNSAFEFIKENWSKVFRKYNRSELAYKQILNSVLSKLTSSHDLDQVLELFAKEKLNLKGFAQDMIIIIEKLKQKIIWKKTYMTTINSWIQNNDS